MNHYDLISPRKRNDKTWWQKIGAAFPRDKGGFSLVFDALPLPDAEGRVMVLMVEPTPRAAKSDGYDTSEAQKRRDENPYEGEAPAGGGGVGDDEIPFGMEWR